MDSLMQGQKVEQSTSSDNLKSPNQRSPTATEPSSAIIELQAAFGSILLTRKETKKFRLPEFGTHKWTGAFELFAFPRELRDRIYFHYLYRPKGVKYRRNTSYVFPFDHVDDITSLFLACRQVYDEALQVFCRYNQVEIIGRNYWRARSRYGKALDGTLRLFPEKPGRLLQRMRVQYSESTFMYDTYDYRQGSQKPGDAFVQMLRGAYAFKNTFPKLRELTVAWQARPLHFASHEDLRFEGRSEDEKKEIWLSWMKKWVGGSNVVPPRWVKFEFTDYWGEGEMQKHAHGLNEAYERLVSETASFREEEAELEESRKRWLEELEE